MNVSNVMRCGSGVPSPRRCSSAATSCCVAVALGSSPAMTMSCRSWCGRMVACVPQAGVANVAAPSARGIDALAIGGMKRALLHSSGGIARVVGLVHVVHAGMCSGMCGGLLWCSVLQPWIPGRQHSADGCTFELGNLHMG
eukprot:100816-Chlamydomonas_euryale.AAC.2